jgi:glycosyltransferase involved in cell wall biosynthesis
MGPDSGQHMKIAYVVNTYPQPSHSFIRREINALERLGVEVCRFAMRHNRDQLVDPVDIAEHDRTEYILSVGKVKLICRSLAMIALAPRRSVVAWRLARVGERRSGRGIAHRVAYFAEACHIVQRCGKLDIDHVHAHFGTNAATVAMMARVLGGPPYSFTVHGPEEFDAPAAIGLREKIGKAAFVVAVSSFGRSQLYRWTDYKDWTKVKVVHCGIEPILFSKPAPFPGGGLRLVAIGRFVEQKGQMLLIEALAKALPERPDIHLTLVGDGEMRPEIEAAIEKWNLRRHVTITGWVDESRIRAELANAHTLIMPSFAEGLPMVIMEAMAAGRPVIATYIAGIPELVQPEANGWLVAAGDSPALAAAILSLAAMPPERLVTMGAAARERALARHDVDVEARKLAAHFAAGQISGTREKAAAGTDRSIVIGEKQLHG